MSTRSQGIETEFGKLVELSLDAVCVAGFDGYLKRVNPAFCQMLGYTHEELLSRPFMNNVHPDDRELVEAGMAVLALGDDIRGFECRQLCADGSVRWVEWNTHAEPVDGVVYAIGRDVSDRHRTSDALSALVDEQAALRRVATLVAEGVLSAELFAAVTREAAHVFSDVDPSLVASVIRFDPGPESVLVGASRAYEQEPLGARWAPKDLYVSTRVLRTGSSARVDEADLDTLGGPDADVLRLRGFLYQVGSPVVVEGQLWGAMCLNSKLKLPPNTDERLESFTELVATAIANAESREAIARLVDEQAALRLLATLVAKGVPPPEIFAEVSSQVADVFALDVESSDVATVVRFDPGPECVLVGESNSIEGLPLGSRWALTDLYVSTRVLRTGHSARVDEMDLDVGGPVADALRRQNLLSQAGSPIIVEGRLWGAMTVNAKAVLPADTEERLEKFTELVGTAIANAESREVRAVLTEEQAALRRVATLVADGTPPSEVFDAAAREVAHALGIDMVTIDRYDPDGASTVVASFNDPGFPVGSRWPLDGPSLGATVLETGRPARIEDYADLQSSSAAVMRDRLVSSAVGAPILVDGRPWGVICVSTAYEPSLPEGVEARLADFTELLATSIARTASREALAHIAEEQAALRRVATLVAEAAAPSAILDAVAGEMQALLGADQVALNRFEPDTQIVVLAHRGLDVDRTPVSSRVSHEGENVTSIVRRTGSPARMENYEKAGGTLAELARATGLRSSVSAPITVEGQVWGVVTASWKGDESPPADTEDRMAKFAHLIDTAIANTEARAEVEQLAEEQAALGRVATLVAEAALPAKIFSAVSNEVATLFRTEMVVVGKFDGDPAALLVVGVGDGTDEPVVGSRWKLDEALASTAVYRTGLPARLDHDSKIADADVAAIVERFRPVATVAVPIKVEGSLWGAMIVSTRDELLPTDTEERLQRFTDLIATALANAEARAEVERLAEEQATLRRLAVLVAQQPSPSEVFTAVTQAVGLLLGADLAILHVFPGDGTATTIASWSGDGPSLPIGSRFPLDGDNLAARIFETGAPARMHSHGESWEREATDLARSLRVRSAVGAPILVEGKLWGALMAATRRVEPWAENAETRIAAFTELVATAIANAESREARAVLTEEQAALRRVATLVARDAPSTEVFEAVATEVGKLLDTDVTVVGRYDSDGAATAIGSWSASGGGVAVGTRSAIGGHNVLTIVAETGKPARVDGYDDASGEAAEIARRHGWRSSIAAPISVEDRLWGVMLVATQRPELFPAGAEERLAAFTDLVATAVANTEARHALERVAAEQAALRRVATLVAQGASPQDLFDAVAEEVGRLLVAANVSMGRYEPDDTVTSMASWSSVGPTFPPGGRWPIKGTNVAWMVLQSGRSARVDDFSVATDPIGVAVREAGYKAAVGSPIVVEGHLWGVISAASTEGPMPPDSEARLSNFSDLVATAIANADGRAELAASRRRIVAASDEARRRIERDLHDGVQQQLVSLSLEVGRVEAGLPAKDALKGPLGSVSENVGSILDSLGEIARGIHPSILSQGGLEAALSGLARRSAVPVELDVQIDGALPDEVEVAAYYVVSETLTNVAKHARASVVHVEVMTENRTLTLTVRDDGIGGAALGRGSGLVGLDDRVEALGGTIAIDSVAGEGTCVAVTLPLAPEPDHELVEDILKLPREQESRTSSA